MNKLKKCYRQHFTPGVSAEIKKYATDTAFKTSRYIFTHREGKQQYGYCTHCNKLYKTEGLKHNKEAICPRCKSICTIKHCNVGRGRMLDEAYITYYQKSVINPKMIVARGIYAVRDYRADYRNVKTKYLVRALYIFEAGAPGVMIERSGIYSMAEKMTSFSWGKRAKVFSLCTEYMNKSWRRRIFIGCSADNIRETVQDTPFQYSTWENYTKIDDLVKFFDLYSRYPCVEYLTKLGLDGLVHTKLVGEHTYSAINWRGKNIFKVLRLTKQDLTDLKKHIDNVTPLFLRLYQMSKKDGSNHTCDEINRIEASYGAYIDPLAVIMKYTTLRSADIYINKQFKKHKDHYRHPGQVLIDWKDYISDCVTLEMDLKKKSVLMPRNLYKAHQNTIKQVKIKASEILNDKVSARAKSLNARYFFEHRGLLIRPPETATEIIEEGCGLNHCVGIYADRHAAGQTTILFIRKSAAPDKPYFTVEIQNNMIYQCRGKKNIAADKVPEVDGFINAFKAEKLQCNKSRDRVKVPA